jgi:hypothetical protein
MANYSIKKEAISALVESGRNILEVVIDNDSRFFKVSSFEPPVGGSVSALPYMSFTGIDITEFITADVFSQADLINYLSRFDFKFQNVQEKTFMFSDNHIWRYFS